MNEFMDCEAWPVGAPFLGVPGKYVTFETGVTAEDKSRDLVTTRDYGAKGDGVTNDTQAFIDLEAIYQGRNIDLLGKTYLVDKAPSKNQYVNGQFKINNQTSKSNGSRNDESGFTPISIKQGEQSAALRYDLLRSSGNGSGNVIQSIAVDTVNRYIYTLTTHAYGGFVDRFSLDGTVRQNSQGRTDFLYGISGHQGLAVEYLDNKDTLLWTSAPYEIPDCVNYATAFRFKFKSNGYPSEYECWKLADEGYVGNGSSTPAISLDQKYLFVRLFRDDICKIRVWDMDFIKQKRLTPDSTTVETVTNEVSNTYTRTQKLYDISEDYCLEFDIDWLNLPGFVQHTAHQDMVCDGKYLYILCGEQYTDQNTFILKYDLLGNLVEQVTVNDFGREDTIAIDIDYPILGKAFREPEGMALLPTKEGGAKLLINIATAYGGTGARRCFVYEFGGKAPVDATQGVNTRSIRDGVEADGIDLIGHRVLMGGVKESRGLTGGGNARLQISSVSTGHGIALNRFSDTTGGSYLSFYKSRGDNVWGNDMTAVQSGDFLGFMNWLGNDGTDAGKTSNIGVQAASIHARCTANPTTGIIPTELIFETSDSTEGLKSRFRMAANGNFEPLTSNASSLGYAAGVFKDLFIQNSPIVSSDERLKQQFRSQSEAEKLAALEIKASICLYKFNDAVDLKGDGARWHVGVKAQQVVSILESHDLNPFDYGFVCYDEWEESETGPAGSRYAIRYDELTMFILSAM